jgi:thioredoxin-related protein
MKVRLETVTNIATIATCAVVCFAFLGRGLINPPAYPQTKPAYKAGDTIRIENVDTKGAPNTLLMFVRSGCHYCTESMGFYEHLADSAEHWKGTFRLVALTPEDESVTANYLDEHSVAVDAVVQIQTNATQFSGTPTLVLVDKDGKVREAWQGQLPVKQESRVLEALGISSN